MADTKNQKTNAMRILDRKKIPYRANYYHCEEFIDAIQIADMLQQSYDQTFKTLVSVGKTGKYYVFVIPIHKELDLKAAARSVREKSIEMLHVKDLKEITGYIRGGCTAIGMKKEYPTVIDSSFSAFDEIIVSGGALGVQIFIAPSDFIRATNAKTENITVQ